MHAVEGYVKYYTDLFRYDLIRFNGSDDRHRSVLLLVLSGDTPTNLRTFLI